MIRIRLLNSLEELRLWFGGICFDIFIWANRTTQEEYWREIANDDEQNKRAEKLAGLVCRFFAGDNSDGPEGFDEIRRLAALLVAIAPHDTIGPKEK